MKAPIRANQINRESTHTFKQGRAVFYAKSADWFLADSPSSRCCCYAQPGNSQERADVGVTHRYQRAVDHLLALEKTEFVDATLLYDNGFVKSSILLQDSPGEEILLYRGAQSIYPIFFSIRTNGIVDVSDTLFDVVPSECGYTISNLDVDYAYHYIAAAFGAGPFDPYFTLTSPIRDVYHVPPGHLVRISLAKSEIHDCKLVYLPDLNFSLEEAQFYFASAFEAVCDFPLIAEKVGIELSGGIDSGIVALSLAAIWNSAIETFSHVYPYPEFRFEKSLFMAALLKNRNMNQTCVDGDKYLPFAELNNVPRHSVPSLSSPSYYQYIGTLEAAKLRNCDTLLTGQGGDRLFSESPFRFQNRQMDYNENPREDVGFLKLGRNIQAEIFERIRFQEAGFASRVSMGDDDISLMHATCAFLDPQWASWLSKEFYGIETTSALAFPSQIRAAWRLWKDESYEWRSTLLQKPLASVLAPCQLPMEIRSRRSKVDHIGMIHRALKRNWQSVNDLIWQNREILDIFCLKPRDLVFALQSPLTTDQRGSRCAWAVLSYIVWWNSIRHRA